MRIPRIYSSTAITGQQTLQLDDNAARHVAQVLRMGIGAELELFDGQGEAFRAHITEAGKRKVSVSIADVLPDKGSDSPLSIHLGLGLSKGERMDWAIQKATELGVSSITPLKTQRCDVKLNSEREAKRLRHWQQVAISACEQCGRNRLPEIHSPQHLAPWLTAQTQELRLVLSPCDGGGLDGTSHTDSAALLIGPEGGLSSEEVASAIDSGFKPWQLGQRVLRTETAPAAAISILQYRYGDMG